MDVQGGEGAPDLLEGDEGGGVGEHEVLHQLLAGHPADLQTFVFFKLKYIKSSVNHSIKFIK